jgi:hypothetical protein
MLISFGASIVIILSSHKETAKKDLDSDTDQTEYFLGVLASLLSIILQASIYVIVRALKDVHHSIVGTA